MDDKARGLYEKFYVKRADGRGAPGQKHNECEYFVLDLTHDPHALPAVRAYAVSCAEDYPTLALEVLQRALECARQRGETPEAEPLCKVCGQDWGAEEADQRCTYAECPYLVDMQTPAAAVVETKIVMQEVYEGYLAYIVDCLNEVGDGGLQRVNPVKQFREWKVARADEEDGG